VIEMSMKEDPLERYAGVTELAAALDGLRRGPTVATASGRLRARGKLLPLGAAGVG
jgi:hypothetical protein